jgi:Flp pilus assembly pilin Flp
MFPPFDRKKRDEGQGLMEYAFILVLVAVVVLAVLLILGPRIGNVFTKVNSSLTSENAGPTQVAATWTTCATEGDFCSFTGTAPVKYGAEDSWVTGIFTDGIDCSNDVFGDPLYGTVKSCQVFK